jgi:hypothetical protein
LQLRELKASMAVTENLLKEAEEKERMMKQDM